MQLTTANRQAYDTQLAAHLWEASADFAGIQKLDLLGDGAPHEQKLLPEVI